MDVKEMLPATRPQVGGLIFTIVVVALVTKYVINPILPDWHHASQTAAHCYNRGGCICGCVETGKCTCRNCNEPKLKDGE